MPGFVDLDVDLLIRLILDFCTFGELPVLRSSSSVDRNPGSMLLGLTIVLVLVRVGGITADLSKSQS